MKKVFSVTVGIPAHNEEKNILKLIRSILKQKQKYYKLEKIIVACDGCTDNTAKVVKQFNRKLPIIEVFDDRKRLGQGKRLENFYKMNKSDIFITFDADTVLGNDHVINNLVTPFKDSRVGLVGGHDRAFLPKGFFEHIVVAGIDLWFEVRKDINDGDVVFNHHGQVSAGRKEFLKKVKYPTGIFANDSFLYFMSKKLKYNFFFAKNAVVFYRAPTNLSDYLSQTTRFLSSKNNINRYFGRWIGRYRNVPRKAKIQAIIISLFRDPIFLALALSLNIFVRIIKFKFASNFEKGVWKTIGSTKYNI